MQLTLLVPGLLLPEPIRADITFDLVAPGLGEFIGRGSREPLPDTWLPATFGLAGDLPAAALRKVGAEGTADDDWLALDPVHLKVSREGVSLTDPGELRLTPDEAASLVAAVAPIFADWGHLTPSQPGCWELRLKRPLALTTRPLLDCIGTPVDARLPEGPDGREWRRLIAEAQPLLHAHPVNQARATAGRPVINSLWPWGQGSLPKVTLPEFTAVWSDDPIITGLARLAGLPCQPSPGRFTPAGGDILAMDTRLAALARSFDALRWRASLETLDKDWIQPMLSALKDGRCTRLLVVAAGAPVPAVGFSLRRRDLWRFWRRPRPLAELA